MRLLLINKVYCTWSQNDIQINTMLMLQMLKLKNMHNMKETLLLQKFKVI